MQRYTYALFVTMEPMGIVSSFVRGLWPLTLGCTSTAAEESLDIGWACYDVCVCLWHHKYASHLY
jgi:hypothetical protein